jgi:hypothetical protein
MKNTPIKHPRQVTADDDHRFVLHGRKVLGSDRVLVKLFHGGSEHCSVDEALACLYGHIYEGWRGVLIGAHERFMQAGHSCSPHASYALLPLPWEAVPVAIVESSAEAVCVVDV